MGARDTGGRQNRDCTFRQKEKGGDFSECRPPLRSASVVYSCSVDYCNADQKHANGSIHSCWLRAATAGYRGGDASAKGISPIISSRAARRLSSQAPVLLGVLELDIRFREGYFGLWQNHLLLVLTMSVRSQASGRPVRGRPRNLMSLLPCALVYVCI